MKSLRFLAAGALLVGTVVTAGSTKHEITVRDKAYYADANTVNFVRPGLVVKIQSASIASDGTITTSVSVTDPKGLPLDKDGITTPGTVSLSFICATIPKGQTQYTSYTTRIATANSGGKTVIQAGADQGGAFTNPSPGVYQYVFKTKAPSGFDNSATHTIGVYSSRNLSEFGLSTYFDSDTYNFIPKGGNVTVVRDVIRTASCTRCHDTLSFHGGSRIGIEMCVLCHTPQTSDPNTLVTVNLPVLIHKIHMGGGSPGTTPNPYPGLTQPYQVIGHSGVPSDWSDVIFPADVRRCEICHDQTPGPNAATQASNYLTKPNREACGACHDNVNFATGANHANLPEVSDNQCAGCHIPQGELEFDVSIKGAHMVPTESATLPGVVVNILKVDNGTAGKKPTVTFTLKDSSGAPIPLTAMVGGSNRIGIVLAGPTTDYGYTNFGSDVTTGGYVSENGTNGSCDTTGTCTYTFTHAIPANANGTYTIGIEARRGATLLPSTTAQITSEYGAINKVINFSVDGSPVAPRRKVVDIAKCNGCHGFLSLHGENRNQIEQCVLCHNPSETDQARRPSATNAVDKATPPQAVSFAFMIHRIHTGDNLPALGAGYTVVGFNGTHNDFTDVRYPTFSPTGSPGDTTNCGMCHVNGSEQNLPFGKNVMKNPQGPVNPVPSITAACTGCHADLPALAHAVANTVTLGTTTSVESCQACHSATADFNISKVHAN